MLLQNAGAQASDKSGANRKITWQKPFGHSTRYFLPAVMHSGSKVFCKSCLKRQEVCRSLTHLVKLMCARFQSKVSYLKNEDKDEGDKSHVHVATFFNIACKFCHFLDMHNRLLEYELIARLINVQQAYPLESTIFTIRNFSLILHRITPLFKFRQEWLAQIINQKHPWKSRL